MKSTKQTLLNYLQDSHEYFIEKLYNRFKSQPLDRDHESSTVGFILSKEEFKAMTGIRAYNANAYYSYHCGCEHDCCGCLSSEKIDITTGNNYVTIIIVYRYNY